VIAWGVTVSVVGAVCFGGNWWLAAIFFGLAEIGFYLAYRSTAREVASHIASAGAGLGILARLRNAVRHSSDVPREIDALLERVERGLAIPRGWIAEVYGLTLQNSFLHAFKVQAAPFWEIWRLSARAGIADALRAAGEIEALASLSAFAYE